MAIRAEGAFASVVHSAPVDAQARAVFASVVHEVGLQPSRVQTTFAAVVHTNAADAVRLRTSFGSVVHTTDNVSQIQATFSSVVHGIGPSSSQVQAYFSSVVHANAVSSAQAQALFSSVVHEVPPLSTEVRSSFASVVTGTNPTTAVISNTPATGVSGVPFTFIGSASVASTFSWAITSVPVGSTVPLGPFPYPDNGAVSPIDMTNNLVLYHADSGGVDSSGNGNDATFINVTLDQPPRLGGASWGYPGTNSQARPTTTVAIGGDWTIAFWFFNLAPNSSWRTGVRGTANHHIIVENGGDRLGLFQGAFRPTNTGFLMPSASYTGWHHIAAVGTGGNTLLYVDGALAGTVIGFQPTDNLVAIGNFQGNNQRFADRVDEFAAWSRALSPIEIADIYAFQTPGPYQTPNFNFTPDIDGVYEVELAVTGFDDGEAVALSTTGELTAGATTKVLNPLQGDSIRFWDHLQGSRFRHRK